MAPMTPYTYIQCPCSDPSVLPGEDDRSQPGSHADADRDDDDDKTFDPRAPRSNYSLYPLEYLLYCEDCHQIRCPRCVAEEIVTYYCPNCLFEVPSSNIKSEGNRCTRSCFQCPVCIGPLAVTSLEAPPGPSRLLAPEGAVSSPSGPYVLTCSYCNWISTEIGIKFDKPNGIYAQLAKLRNGGRPRLTAKERKDGKRKDLSGGAPPLGYATSASPSPPSSSQPDNKQGDGAEDDETLDMETQFAKLKAFYGSQLAETSQGPGGGSGLSALGDLGFSSPGSLSRIMSLYTGGSLADKKVRSRNGTMREALSSDEGLQVANLDESAAVARLRRGGWDGTASSAQMAEQPPHAGEADLHGAARFVDELRPIPYLLRTKRSKRCPLCRHIISKPENKVTSTRFRIRLVAGSYIPSISVRSLTTGLGGSGAPPGDEASDLLAPLRPVQYLLTFKNPIFETVKVTLATPATTPGRFASKVTLLCPQFEIDANTDVWDEALKDGEKKDRRRRRGEDGQQQQQHQAEAGKIWERGRNWVSIVVEVVPASLQLDTPAPMKAGDVEHADHPSPLKEDEDLLEIPMFVRVEWEADAANDEVGTAVGKDKDAKEKRELAYWCVLGIGRISQE